MSALFLAALSLFLFTPFTLMAPQRAGLDGTLSYDLNLVGRYQSILVLRLHSEAPAAAAVEGSSSGISIDFGDVTSFGEGTTPAGLAGRNLSENGAAYQTSLLVEAGVAGFSGADLKVQAGAGDSMTPLLYEADQSSNFRDLGTLTSLRNGTERTVRLNLSSGWTSLQRQVVLNILDKMRPQTLRGEVTYTLTGR